jgi:hypothetical protein
MPTNAKKQKPKNQKIQKVQRKEKKEDDYEEIEKKKALKVGVTIAVISACLLTGILVYYFVWGPGAATSDEDSDQEPGFSYCTDIETYGRICYAWPYKTCVPNLVSGLETIIQYDSTVIDYCNNNNLIFPGRSPDGSSGLLELANTTTETQLREIVELWLENTPTSVPGNEFFGLATRNNSLLTDSPMSVNLYVGWPDYEYTNVSSITPPMEVVQISSVPYFYDSSDYFDSPTVCLNVVE